MDKFCPSECPEGDYGKLFESRIVIDGLDSQVRQKRFSFPNIWSQSLCYRCKGGKIRSKGWKEVYKDNFQKPRLQNWFIRLLPLRFQLPVEEMVWNQPTELTVGYLAFPSLILDNFQKPRLQNIKKKLLNGETFLEYFVAMNEAIWMSLMLDIWRHCPN